MFPSCGTRIAEERASSNGHRPCTQLFGSKTRRMRRESIHRTGRTETDERKRRGGGGGGRENYRIYRIHPRRRENGRAKRKGGKKEGKRERRTKKLRYRRIIKLYNEEEGGRRGWGGEETRLHADEPPQEIERWKSAERVFLPGTGNYLYTVCKHALVQWYCRCNYIPAARSFFLSLSLPLFLFLSLYLVERRETERVPRTK